ncbi:hypothetical protein GO755_32040 [Spirosoma sp. HMF4905]|uniref:Uncharacterized protein n=1 Tax=Spirosoma arboris TaxID=2682092 RepID=A0A7K1SM12_9BACT|nr:hypothetical protein [Spirosoma arboris]MVM34703.1 hypothetical protein [Spirosoma arboris]
MPDMYVPGRLDKYRKLSVISGIATPIVYLLMAPVRQRINIELLLGVSATFLSLAALVVSIFQTKIAREQQHASVWPHLKDNYIVMDKKFTWSLINNGVGPAILKKCRLVYKGKLYESPYDLMNEQIQRSDYKNKHIDIGFFYSNVRPGEVIKSDGELLIGEITNSERIPEAFMHIVNDPLYHFTVVYSDVYGNCWQLDQGKVTSLTKCPD